MFLRASVLKPADNHVKATRMCPLPHGYVHEARFLGGVKCWRQL
jgi:hypothetical protein